MTAREYEQQGASECGCPSWVIRCLHHRDGMLLLTDGDLCKSPHRPPIVVRLCVWSTSGQWAPCACHGVSVIANKNLRKAIFFDTLPEARAAFEAEEKRIRAAIFGRPAKSPPTVAAPAAAAQTDAKEESAALGSAPSSSSRSDGN